MIKVAVKLGYGGVCNYAPKNENVEFRSGLGCKWSLVRIQSRRPLYVPVITKNLSLKSPTNRASEHAHRCSKTKAKEGVAGGKIGVNPSQRIPIVFRPHPESDPFILSHRERISEISTLRSWGGSMDILVTIAKWEKHNPRKDVKRPSWFAFDNRMVEDDDLFDFTHGEFKAWVYLLSKASQKQNPVVAINFEAASRKSNIAPKDFKSAIKKLVDMGALSFDADPVSDHERMQKIDARNAVKTAINNGSLIRPKICSECGGDQKEIEAHHEDYSRPLDIKWLCTSCHGKTRAYGSRTSAYGLRTLQTDRQTLQTIHNSEAPTDPNVDVRAAFDLLKIYEAYPRKEGKAKGLKRLKTIVTSQNIYDRVSAAQARYVAHCSAKNVAPEYILHFSTFVNSWTDWEDPATGSCNIGTINWDDEAGIVQKAVATFPVGDAKIWDWMGPERSAIVKAAGGLSVIRSINRDAFSLKRLANLLQKANQEIQAQPMEGA